MRLGLPSEIKPGKWTGTELREPIRTYPIPTSNHIIRVAVGPKSPRCDRWAGKHGLIQYTGLTVFVNQNR